MNEDNSDKPELSYHLFHSLHKDSNNNGCGKRKCPCRTWLNCEKYVDTTKRKINKKLKSPKRKNVIKEWYLIYFRFEGEFHNLYCSG